MARSAATLPTTSPPAPVASAAWGRRVRWLAEHLTLYMPVLLMALLAAASYWLLRATPSAQLPAEQPPVRHEPGDVMRRFSVRTFGADGALHSEVFGIEARRFVDDDSMEIDQARIRHFNPKGGVTTATARKVWVNAVHDHFLLTGNAVVVRDAATLATGEKLERLSFRGERLEVFSEERRVASTQPVELMRGTSRATADQMTYDDKARVAVLQGRVKAVLDSRKAP